ncbi:MAG: Lrp/AsnC family transcriptional regulator [Candidatus Aenigmarchaeota archaeon]|nr:Lrp/AsnC family transcriptional regulator [Candidatus Aenigmarchaeota archaeon]
MKLDLKDKKILYELSKNCRRPLNKLSKKVALSREVIDYRIKKMVKEKVIEGFYTEIDETKLGFGRHIVYIVFHKVTETKEKEIIDKIVAHPFVSWTTVSMGKWSIIFDFITDNIKQINDFVEELKLQYKYNIGEYMVASQIYFQHFNYKYYNVKEKKKLFETIEKERKYTNYKLDRKDIQLLRILSDNARMSCVDISSKIGTSPNTVKNRIKALMNAGIIKSFFIQPNKELFGYSQYYLQLDFVNQTKDEEKRVVEYVIKHPNVNAYYKPLGHWSMELAVFVKNSAELRKIIIDLRNLFGNIMKVHDAVLFYEEPKSNYLPTGVFDSLEAKYK